MTISTYVELQDAIGNFMVREDFKSSGEFADRTKEFIALTEADLNSWHDDPSRNRKAFLLSFMETRATDTFTAGDRYLAVPPDLKAVRRMVITSTDPDRNLSYMEADEFSERYRLGETGTPSNWTQIGDEFAFGKTPASGMTVEITYWAKITATGATSKPDNQKPLSATNTTNWILDNQPDIYLFGALTVASVYRIPGVDLSAYPALYERAVSNAISADGARAKPESGIRMRATSSTP